MVLKITYGKTTEHYQGDNRPSTLFFLFRGGLVDVVSLAVRDDIRDAFIIETDHSR